MSFIKKSIIALSAICLLFASCDDEEKGDVVTIGDKQGIVLVTFGSSYPDPQETFKTIDASANTEFLGEEIRWGFTSDLIVNKLRKGEGEGSLNGVIIDNDSPEEMLELMVKDGYSTFAVQSLHVIPGEEFDELNEAVEAIEAEYDGVHISVGKPLLYSDDDIAAVAQIMAAKFATQIEEGPVCFMGHGTPHEANNRYSKLEVELKKINANFFVGTVEGITFESGESSVGSIVEAVDALNLTEKVVTISPLMSIAGDHANNDMNANTGATDVAEMSWREYFQSAGYTVNAVMKGLGDYEEINAIWMSHLEAVMYE